MSIVRLKLLTPQHFLQHSNQFPPKSSRSAYANLRTFTSVLVAGHRSCSNIGIPSSKPRPNRQEDGIGPRQRVVCEWYTNFENRRFEQCHILGGAAPLLEDGASIECVSQSCKERDAAARKAVRWKKQELVLGRIHGQGFRPGKRCPE